MTSVKVFDPAMCCSTGACGPSVDPDLARFAADLNWLAAEGVSVERFNLAQQPEAFVTHAVATQALREHGEQALPLVPQAAAVRVVHTAPVQQPRGRNDQRSLPSAEEATDGNDGWAKASLLRVRLRVVHIALPDPVS